MTISNHFFPVQPEGPHVVSTLSRCSLIFFIPSPPAVHDTFPPRPTPPSGLHRSRPLPAQPSPAARGGRQARRSRRAGRWRGRAVTAAATADTAARQVRSRQPARNLRGPQAGRLPLAARGAEAGGGPVLGTARCLALAALRRAGERGAGAALRGW